MYIHGCGEATEIDGINEKLIYNEFSYIPPYFQRKISLTMLHSLNIIFLRKNMHTTSCKL